MLTLRHTYFSDWEHVGGCFWFIQQEILRFAAIHLFRSDMKRIKFQSETSG
jgi:hypothetical protein